MDDKKISYTNLKENNDERDNEEAYPVCPICRNIEWNQVGEELECTNCKERILISRER